jgi:transcriptional regulator NrdR family protein
VNCPSCGHKQHRVMNTRQEGPETTIRQRICQGCAHMFYTLEIDMPQDSVQWHHNHMRRLDGYKHIRFS